MKKIKFRAWDSESEIMIFDIQNNINYGKFSFPFIINNDRFSVMQFTGLHDENGFEIYEGDIVETVYGSFAVEWNDDTCKFQYPNGMDINDGEMYGTTKYVIGNIYETRNTTS
jgi:uncharacterized phage protein (TIGR01671 family)